jgi:outer membrane lipoprotein SlyB
MNTYPNTFEKSKTHPMLIIAGIAIVLFCGVGIAAFMGWLPASLGGNVDKTDSSVPALTNPVGAPVHHAQAHSAPVHVAANSSVKRACANCGIVESTRDITTRAQGSGVGAAGGAVVGGLLGNQVGGGHGKEAMTVVGAIGGAIAGNQIEGQMKATHSFETTVRLEDGSLRAVMQATQPGWQAGDHVKIIDGVVRAND